MQTRQQHTTYLVAHNIFEVPPRPRGSSGPTQTRGVCPGVLAPRSAVEVRIPTVTRWGRAEVAHGRGLGWLVRLGRGDPRLRAVAIRQRSGTPRFTLEDRRGYVLAAGTIRTHRAETGEVQLACHPADVLAGAVWACVCVGRGRRHHTRNAEMSIRHGKCKTRTQKQNGESGVRMGGGRETCKMT